MQKSICYDTVHCWTINMQFKAGFFDKIIGIFLRDFYVTTGTHNNTIGSSLFCFSKSKLTINLLALLGRKE